MEKKLYYQFSDGAKFYQSIMSLDDCMTTIEEDMQGCNQDEDRSYFITPTWLTDEEFEMLPKSKL